MKKYGAIILTTALVSFTAGAFWGLQLKNPKIAPETNPESSADYEFIPRPPQASTSAQFSQQYLESLSEDEQAVAQLITDGKRSLAENYFLIRITSKEGPLDITNCEPKPIALRITYGTSLKVINRDSIGHMINFGDFEGYVPPQKSREFKADFKGGPGVYVYSCDRYPKGVFWLYPKGLFPKN